MNMNFICMNHNCNTVNYMTIDVDVVDLKKYSDKLYGEYEYILCPICKSRAKLIGYPAGFSMSDHKLNLNEQRQKYAKDLLQPHREGQASKEFIEAYPKQASEMFTKEEIRSAKDVWK